MGKKRKIKDEDLEGVALIKETNRRIRLARTYWDAHKNGACRQERERALRLYERLTPRNESKSHKFCGSGFATEARNTSDRIALPQAQREGRTKEVKIGGNPTSR